MKRIAVQLGLVALGFMLGSAVLGRAQSPAEPVGTYQITAVHGSQFDTIYRVDTQTGTVCEVRMIGGRGSCQ